MHKGKKSKVWLHFLKNTIHWNHDPSVWYIDPESSDADHMLTWYSVTLCLSLYIYIHSIFNIKKKVRAVPPKMPGGGEPDYIWNSGGGPNLYEISGGGGEAGKSPPPPPLP